VLPLESFSTAITTTPHMQGAFPDFLWKVFLMRRLLRVQVLAAAGGGGQYAALLASVFDI